MLPAAAALFLAAQPAPEPINGCPGAFVFFQPGSAELDDRALQNIELMLLWMRPMVEAGAWLEINGGADDAPSQEAIARLVSRRANAARDYLLRRGFRPHQIRLEARNIQLVATIAGRSDAQNRVALVHPAMPDSVFRRFFPPGAPIC